MSQNSITWCWRLGLASSLAAFGVISSFRNSTLAQVTPDVKLGVESAAIELLIAQAAPPPPPPLTTTPIPAPTPIPPPSTSTPKRPEPSKLRPVPIQPSSSEPSK